MSRRRLLVATAAVALVAVYITTGRTGIRVDGPLVAQHQGWFQGSGNDAIVGGTLRYDHGCLLLDEDAVLWPDGAEWDENEQTVDLVTAGWRTSVMASQVEVASSAAPRTGTAAGPTATSSGQ